MAAKEPILTGAVDLARAAAVEAADRPGDVGEHLGFDFEGERLVSHKFAAELAGYPGWHWSVTLARVPRGRYATICEVELIPGEAALLAPPWIPWSERIRPGDIGVGDVLPFITDDPRLEPGWQPDPNDPDPLPPIDDLALARMRVLNAVGRAEAAGRWYRGKHGPTSAGSLKASAACSTCAFALPLAGSMGQIFAACSNAWSPDDGQVVSLDHGCGAHSETDVDYGPTNWPDAAPVIDELEVLPLTLFGSSEQPEGERGPDDVTP
ncbi:MAG: DUF3027 domain-containing protein [Promicromonosporaceae bacterium]|nr:DUF3027 domain-containing protein [Promicromonosporaceae bacterium]